MTNKKTAKIGETRDGTSEFGEIYHAVVGHYLNPSFYPEFVDFEAGREFFELFAKVEKCPEPDNSHLTDTVEWIVNGYRDEIGQSLWKKVLELANEKKWETRVPKPFRTLLTNDPKVLIWLRSKTYRHHRNISLKAIRQLTELCEQRGSLPVFIGEKLAGMPEGAIGLWDFYKDEFFQEDAGIAKQLWCLNLLYEKCGVLASVGMMSGAMDGLAMICGKKVVFLAKENDAKSRMAKVSMVVPALHWVELFYNGNFQQLSDEELREIEKKVFG